MILAAGKGQRLRDSRGRPKCLREVGGLPLVHHQLRALARAGIDDVVIVVGFQQDQVRSVVGSAASYVVNPRFAETNSMYSFLLARSMLRDDVIVMNSDLFFHPVLIRRLLEPRCDALLYDSSSGEQDEHMKVRTAGGRLVEMSKSMRGDRVSGENVGILRLSTTTAQHVLAAATRIAAEGGENAWLAAAVNLVAFDHVIRCVDVAGWPWVEIDFPEDLARARSEVLPSVAATIRMDAPEPVGAPFILRSVS